MPTVAEYYGNDLSKTEYWTLEMNRIHERHRIDEAELLLSRWYDYRMMSAAQVTYLFAAQYAHEYIECYKRTRDIRTADEITPFAPEDIFASKELIPMWLARQEADRIGCKYDFYLRLAFDRFADRGWRNIPRPNQLYGEELVLDIRDAWKRRCSDLIQFAENSFFTEVAYVAHPDQDAYHVWLVEQIKQRGHHHLALSRVLKDKILPLELIEREFSEEVIKRAKYFSSIE